MRSVATACLHWLGGGRAEAGAGGSSDTVPHSTSRHHPIVHANSLAPPDDCVSAALPLALGDTLASDDGAATTCQWGQTMLAQRVPRCTNDPEMAIPSACSIFGDGLPCAINYPHVARVAHSHPAHLPYRRPGEHRSSDGHVARMSRAPRLHLTCTCISTSPQRALQATADDMTTAHKYQWTTCLVLLPAAQTPPSPVLGAAVDRTLDGVCLREAVQGRSCTTC